MDSITRTAQSSIVSYYNALRRMGSIHRQDKYHLLVLWLFHYLKNRSDFLYKWNADLNKFEVDRELEAWLEQRFRCNIACLMGSSCFIKLLPDDNCTPILEILWEEGGEDEEPHIRILVTNATYALQENNDNTTGEDVDEILNSMIWSNGSAVMRVNNDNDDDWMTTNDNENTHI